MNWLKRKYFTYQAERYLKKYFIQKALGLDTTNSLKQYRQYIIRCSLCS